MAKVIYFKEWGIINVICMQRQMSSLKCHLENVFQLWNVSSALFFLFNETIIHFYGLFLKNINMSITASVLGQTKVCSVQYPISGSAKSRCLRGTIRTGQAHILFSWVLSQPSNIWNSGISWARNGFYVVSNPLWISLSLAFSGSPWTSVSGFHPDKLCNFNIFKEFIGSKICLLFPQLYHMA